LNDVMAFTDRRAMSPRAMSELPPCGLYRTRAPIGEVPAGRLVSFHNHGNPGPGIYLPAGWVQNRANFHDQGHTLENARAQCDDLEPLRAEGFYRVVRTFECCKKKCRTFDDGLLVQLGYDGEANAILFVPEWRPTGFVLPDRGSRTTSAALENLVAVKVPGTSAGLDRTLH
jgi:hypothetical protein